MINHEVLGFVLIIVLVVASIILINQLIIKETNQKFMGKHLKTLDGVRIAYNLYQVESSNGWLILVHMMPATKESWRDFANELQKHGYESLAIDLRGHGESEGGPEGYKNFGDAEHQASIKDLEAAWKFLESRGATPEKTILVGASIGGNLSLQFLAGHPDFKKGVLLSPGLNYRGLETLPLVKKLKLNQSLVFAVSKDDGDNVSQNKALYNSATSKNKHLIIFDAGGHGTNMFKAKEEYDLTGAILKFLDYGSIN